MIFKIIVKNTLLTVIILLCFSSCKKSQDTTSENLIRKIEAVENLDVELVFECNDPLVAVDSDKEGNFFLDSYTGNIFKVSENGTSDTIYSGVESCGFSFTSLTVLSEGSLLTSDCVDDKDVLFKINENGKKTEFLRMESNLLTLTSDNSGRVYAGTWVSEGDLTVNFNPNHLSAADYIAGKILEIDKNGNAEEIYEGGIPMCLRIDASGKLTAAVWGEKGGFEAESESYSVADLRHIFWVTLSEKAKIIYPKEDKMINTGGLNAISSFVFLDDNAIIVQGIHEIGGAGLYLLKEGIDPIELTFNQEKIDHSITGLEVSNGNLYFINVEGKLYKVK
jgi:hypothetical protein